MTPRALAAAAWLIAWQAASQAVSQRFLLVSPPRAIAALIALMGTAPFYVAVLSSFGRILAGFALAMALGVLLALAAHRLRWVAALLAPAMAAVKATPVASFVILALIWVPSRHLSVLTGFLMVLPIAYVNALAGLKSADAHLIEMARVFRLPPLTRLRAIYLPAAWPHLVAACELSLGLCWKAGIAAEVIGLPDRSIGAALYQAKVFLNTPELFAWTIAIVLISQAFEKGALAALRRCRVGQPKAGRRGRDGDARGGAEQVV
ncbi:MAG: ABC transporter permease subunit [Clostridiales bacterium]|nr:ABC transporter permease subunit [Clostridiales bacterium]